MPPQQSQPNNANQSAAALSFATQLQDQLLPKAQPEQPTSPGNEPGTQEQPNQQQDVQAEIQGLETRLMDELKTLREDMKTQGDGKAELADLKKQIESILNETD